MVYLLNPLSKIHLYNPDGTDQGMMIVRIFFIVAVIVLLIASINYVNLITLGAGVPHIITLLSKDFLALVLIATAIAFPVTWYGLSNFLQSYAYRTDISWWVFIFAGLATLVIALLTVSFKCVQAALANPVKSLRTE